MTSARERAVEAGARAASPHAFNDAFWRARGAPDHHQKHVQANARKHAEAALRAAFPILAEELVKEIEAEADDLEQIAQDYLDGKHPGKPDLCKRTASDFSERSDAVRQMAPALRARIQQMAEAL